MRSDMNQTFTGENWQQNIIHDLQILFVKAFRGCLVVVEIHFYSPFTFKSVIVPFCLLMDSISSFDGYPITFRARTHQCELPFDDAPLTPNLGIWDC